MRLQNRAQRRAARTRERLLHAALARFSEKGVDNSTIEDITEAADLGKGTFYRHFESKEEVLVALIADAVERIIESLRSSQPERRSLKEVLEHLIDVHFTFMRDRRQEFTLLFQGRLMFKLERDVASDLEQPFGRYVSVIESAVAPFLSQEAYPARTRLVAYVLAGFLSGFCSFAMLEMEPEQIWATTEPLRHAFVVGLLAFLEAAKLPDEGQQP